MAIATEPAPDAVDALVAERLRLLPPARPGLDVDTSRLYAPLAMRSSSVDQLARADGEAIPGLERTGWRVLIDEDGSFAVADLADAGDGLEVQSVFRGPPGETLARASAVADALGDDDYEASLLDLRELGTTALWLRSPTGPSAVVVLGEEPVVMGMGAFTAILRPLARRRLEASLIVPPEVE